MKITMIALVALALGGCKGTASDPAAAPRAPESGAAPAATDSGAPQNVVSLSAGSAGIGFDDLVFAPTLRKVLAPAGATGTLALVDPDTFAVTSIGGFAASSGAYAGGHGEGTTSSDEGRGLLFAIDRNAKLLDVVDPSAKAIVASAKLAASPDYVRFVPQTGEVWVTEPDAEQIEVFAIRKENPPQPSSIAKIAVKGGPESLVIDGTRNRAFSHLWKGATVSVDVRARAITATWPNGCTGSRGIALDEKRGFLFAGCAEGKAATLDVDHGGKVLGSASSGAGVDVIAYSAALGHVYLPGATSATMAVLGVKPDGSLEVLGTVPTAKGAHCVSADDRGHAWVCDPDKGRLLIVNDAFPRAN